MSDIENVQAEAAGPEQKQTPKKSRFLPSWWVKQPKPEKVKKPLKQEIIEWGVTLVVAFLLAFLIRMFIFEPVQVDGNSMFPTLHDGELMIVSKLDYGSSFFGIPFTGIGTYFPVGGDPQRFDVVVCNYPGRLNANGSRINFVKRLVGLPGDTVEIRGGKLYVNGVGYDEIFLYQDMRSDMALMTIPAQGDTISIRDGKVYFNGEEQVQAGQYLSVVLHQLMDGGKTYTLPETGDTFEIHDYYMYVNGRNTSNWAALLLNAWNGKTFTVSEDHYFLMGDNRNNSHDCRSSIVGPVTRDMIVGKVESVIWHRIPSSLDYEAGALRMSDLRK